MTPRADAKFEARVEEEVRRRILSLLSSAGLPETEVAREVHYWMPQEFMEFYRDLFLKALQLEGRGHEGHTRTNTRGERVSVGDNHRVGVGVPRQRKRETDEAYAERIRPLIGATGSGGKRYKNHYIIRDAEAFKTKELVDRRLMEMVQGVGIRARDRRKSRSNGGWQASKRENGGH